MADSESRPVIWVLAGASGAGKSSVGGELIRSLGEDYYNPDEAAATLRSELPGMAQEDADSHAWHQGRLFLEEAMQRELDFAFETTLGGKSMLAKLQEAAALGFDVNVWFVGLASPDLNVARVRAREAAGGHTVSERLIRSRYDDCRKNLISLIPFLAGLRVYDNSQDGDLAQGIAPKPQLLLHMVRRAIAFECAPEDAPEWVKPILVAARHLASPWG